MIQVVVVVDPLVVEILMMIFMMRKSLKMSRRVGVAQLAHLGAPVVRMILRMMCLRRVVGYRVGADRTARLQRVVVLVETRRKRLVEAVF
jgi:hypothetical protein